MTVRSPRSRGRRKQLHVAASYWQRVPGVSDLEAEIRILIIWHEQSFMKFNNYDILKDVGPTHPIALIVGKIVPCNDQVIQNHALPLCEKN